MLGLLVGWLVVGHDEDGVMKKRLILLAGLGAGFILGSRAWRESYEKLKAQVERLTAKGKSAIEKQNAMMDESRAAQAASAKAEEALEKVRADNATLQADAAAAVDALEAEIADRELLSEEKDALAKKVAELEMELEFATATPD